MKAQENDMSEEKVINVPLAPAVKERLERVAIWAKRGQAGARVKKMARRTGPQSQNTDFGI